MNQTAALLTTLKKQLRAQGITYGRVAEALDLSEASVKRLFAEQSFTLPRLETVCELAGMQLTELAALSQRQQSQLEQLTWEQEAEIAGDLLLLLTAVSIINGFSYRDLLKHYTISETQCVQKLAHLDRLKLIELLPGNRIKLKVSPNFHWLPNGPIQQFFLSHVQQEFFASTFDAENEKLLVLNGLLSAAGNLQLQEKMERLAREFNDQLGQDRHLGMAEKQGNTMVIAIRQWRYGVFSRFARATGE